MKSPPLSLVCVLLVIISQVSAKPFYWGDMSYHTTKVPLLKRAFSKINHWFKELIDAYPSSTWHWKEHFYGRTFWKDPVLVRGWLSITDPGPLAMKYRERNTPKNDNLEPWGWPGQTRPKLNPDFIDDNILSIPDSSELARIEAKMSTKKKRPQQDGRFIQRGPESESYELYNDPNNRQQEREAQEEKDREDERRAMTEKTTDKRGRAIQRGASSGSYEVYKDPNNRQQEIEG